MKTTQLLNCEYCKNDFEKLSSEVKRQLKKNPSRKFYCSLHCHGKVGNNHLSEWKFSTENDLALRYGSITTYRKYDDEEKPFSEYLRRCRNRTTRKNRKQMGMDIDIPYLLDLWNTQQGLCAFSGIPLVHGGNNVNFKASLDRIDSSKGYIKGNVQFVSCALNYAKGSEPDSSIVELISLIKQFS